METLQNKHDARLNFRLSRDTKEKIEKAALLTGQSLSDFASSTLLRSATDILERQQRTLLSERDFARFREILEADEEPTEAAKKAAAEYNQGRVEGSRYHW